MKQRSRLDRSRALKLDLRVGASAIRHVPTGADLAAKRELVKVM
jgi:hypothetical protein